jgi:hypothetical protein
LDEIIALHARPVSTERPKSQRLLPLAEGFEFQCVSTLMLCGIVRPGELPVIRTGGNGHDRVPVSSTVEISRVDRAQQSLNGNKYQFKSNGHGEKRVGEDNTTD